MRKDQAAGFPAAMMVSTGGWTYELHDIDRCNFELSDETYIN